MAIRVFFVTLVAAAASLQAVYAEELKVVPLPEIRWHGPVTPGKPDQMLQVTDIYDLLNKIMKLNPKWVGEIPIPEETLKDYGRRVCGFDSGIGTGNSHEVNRLLIKLRSIRGYYTLDAGKCHRLACGVDTGIYWCNYNKWSIRTSAKALFTQASHILHGCCHRHDGSLFEGDPIAGYEYFPDTHMEAAHSKVLIGYGRCEDGLGDLPPSYLFPGKLGVCRPD